MPKEVKPKVVVAQDAEEPVGKKVLAASIVELGKAAAALLNSGLKRSDLVALLRARCGWVKKDDIEAVVGGLEQLEKDYRR